MTDIMKLIERLRNVGSPICITAADAIDALQGEVEQVKGFWKEAQLRNRNLLEESNDLAFLADQYKAERDALAAELATLKAQEPVAWIFPNDLQNMLEMETFKQVYSVKVGSPEGESVPLYAAPKALAPEPLIKFRHGCKWCGKAKCAAGCHGIGGTP